MGDPKPIGAPYPKWLDDAETAAIEQRRDVASALELPGDQGRVGLALSGGGIRSATFSLGVLQALARADLLRGIDYLSTVSGGGYIGSFLGALYSRSDSKSPAGPRSGAKSRADEVRARLTGPRDSFSVSWLRENGRYLAPNGAGASWLAGAILLRNWIAVAVVFAAGATFVAFATDLVHLYINRLHHWLEAGPVSHPLILAPWGVLGHDASPLFVLPVTILLLGAIPFGLAYWFVPVHDAWAMRALAAVLLLFVIVSGTWASGDFAAPSHAALLLVDLVLAFALTSWTLAGGWKNDPDAVVRYRLSSCLKSSLVIALMLGGVALCDAMGKALYEHFFLPGEVEPRFFHVVGAFYGTVAVLVAAAHRILALLGSVRAPKARSVLPWVAVAAALGCVLAGSSLASVLSHYVIWHGEHSGKAEPIELARADIGFAAAGLATVLLGLFNAFVNESSLAAFYAARLTRTYLGASNPDREKAATGANDLHGISSTEPIAGDSISIVDYAPHLNGGPLHLINATINETIDPRVQVKQPDRHGLTMAIGPCSVSAGVRHHARRVPKVDGGDGARTFTLENPDYVPKQFSVFPKGRITPEALDLGEWVAISGAAVAPGLGSRTRLGNSILLTLFNMRLGYWWESGIGPWSREGRAPYHPSTAVIVTLSRVFPVYGFLVGELLARFPGTGARHWYLSDGGHFENTACYELVRRELPLIVCCDAGADPDYAFNDLANLVRLARIDFGAEITFLDDAAIARIVVDRARFHVGALESLGRARWPAQTGPKTPHAALARIQYASGREGLLLVLKPTMCGDETLDVRNYGATHESFPQESTADQFFDDAQWEAYRRLGEHVATCVFGGGASWPVRLDGVALGGPVSAAAPGQPRSAEESGGS